MLIKIVEVGSPELKQGPKAKYSVFELSYESEGQLRKRKIMSFAKEVYATLKGSNPGEHYDIVTKKNGEYWDWVGATKQEGAGATHAAASTGGGSYGRESAEERAQRQVMIVRQSSLGHAVEALGPGQTSDVYIEMAKYFEAYVLDFNIESEDEEIV
jgi:hypothetical protein